MMYAVDYWFEDEGWLNCAVGDFPTFDEAWNAAVMLGADGYDVTDKDRIRVRAMQPGEDDVKRCQCGGLVCHEPSTGTLECEQCGKSLREIVEDEVDN